jgi:antitoxin component of RelBE/YafQ-DinJ toxin-antitoxin module
MLGVGSGPQSGSEATAPEVGSAPPTARLDDEHWARAEQMARANGVAHVSRLCEMLLEREATRLGMDQQQPAAPVSEETGEHRLNVRVEESLWLRAQHRTAALGLDAVSDLCRILLEKEIENWELTNSSRATRRKKI